MEANEIRVGNWLNDPRPFNEDTKKFFKMTDNGYFKATARDIQYAEEFEPITLTEEILLKCGFEKTGITELYYSTDTINISWFEEDPTVIEINCENIQCYIINCEYLHQLQNLYFALKGQELEINL